MVRRPDYVAEELRQAASHAKRASLIEFELYVVQDAYSIRAGYPVPGAWSRVWKTFVKCRKRHASHPVPLRAPIMLFRCAIFV